MRHLTRFAGAFTLTFSMAALAAAQNVSPPVQTAAACAVHALTTPVPIDALRLIGAQDSVGRALFGAGDLVVVAGGQARGVQLAQQFFVRRPTRPTVQGYGAGSGLRAATTAGWVRVVAVNDTTAIAIVEFACDGLLAGDYLDPYVAPVIPPDAERTDTSGEPDFSMPGRVLFGDNERSAGATGDFMVTDVGEARGAAPGARFAIYRNVGVAGLPLAAVGEAVVVFVDPQTSVVRLTRTRDAIYTGDLVVPRQR